MMDPASIPDTQVRVSHLADKSISPIVNGVIQLQNTAQLIAFAKTMLESGLAPKGFKTWQAIFAGVAFGSELGLSPNQSMRSVAVVGQRASLFGEAVGHVAKSDKDCLKIVEYYELKGERLKRPLTIVSLKEVPNDYTAVCECHLKSQPDDPVIRSFSVGEAKLAGLWGVNTWIKFPNRMLRFRPLGYATRDAYAALSGIMTHDEAMALEATPVEYEVKDEPANLAELAQQSKPEAEPEVVEQRAKPVAEKPKAKPKPKSKKEAKPKATPVGTRQAKDDGSVVEWNGERWIKAIAPDLPYYGIRIPDEILDTEDDWHDELVGGRSILKDLIFGSVKLLDPDSEEFAKLTLGIEKAAKNWRLGLEPDVRTRRLALCWQDCIDRERVAATPALEGEAEAAGVAG